MSIKLPAFSFPERLRWFFEASDDIVHYYFHLLGVGSMRNRMGSKKYVRFFPLLFLFVLAGAKDVNSLLLSLSPPGAGKGDTARHESEHRAVPLRNYWVHGLGSSSPPNALIIRPDGSMLEKPPQIKPEGVCVSFETPVIGAPFHGIHNTYVVDRHVENEELVIRVAKWITIHHSCSWGHDYKYDPEKLAAKPSSSIPLEIVSQDLWDRNFHIRVTSGTRLRAQVLHFGVPVEGVKLRVTTARGWTKGGVTDANGTAEFQLIRDYFPSEWSAFKRTHRDKLQLVAEYETDEGGEYEGQGYTRTRLISTLPWVYSPGKSEYASLSHGLLVGLVTLAVTGLGIYAYRERRRRPYRGIEFSEKD